MKAKIFDKDNEVTGAIEVTNRVYWAEPTYAEVLRARKKYAKKQNVQTNEVLVHLEYDNEGDYIEDYHLMTYEEVMDYYRNGGTWNYKSINDWEDLE